MIRFRLGDESSRETVTCKSDRLLARFTAVRLMRALIGVTLSRTACYSNNWVYSTSMGFYRVSHFQRDKWLMYDGSMIFPQLVGLLPPRQVRHCVNRYRSNHRVRTFSCRDQFLCMAFAQLTGRQSLRDIEACPRAMGPIRAKKNMDFAVRLSRKVDKTLGLRCDQTITLCGTKRLCCLSSCRCPCGRGLLFEQLLHGDLGGS